MSAQSNGYGAFVVQIDSLNCLVLWRTKEAYRDSEPICHDGQKAESCRRERQTLLGRGTKGAEGGAFHKMLGHMKP